ncbi:MAG: phosphonate C-P lyase system protein PhnH [Sphingomonadaceae bacterium]
MLPGFSDPGRDSQKLFRILMDAIARPGVIADVPHGPDAPGKLSSAAAAIALSLFDFETRVWLDDAVGTDTLAGWLRFHCGCPLTTNPAEAHFAIVADIASAPPLSAFMQGEPRYPDQSTTIIFDLPALSGGIAVELDGPGIRTPITIAPVGPTAEFWASAQDNHEQFQCGVDMIFTSGARLLGLPRSSNITLKEG